MAKHGGLHPHNLFLQVVDGLALRNDNLKGARRLVEDPIEFELVIWRCGDNGTIVGSRLGGNTFRQRSAKNVG